MKVNKICVFILAFALVLLTMFASYGTAFAKEQDYMQTSTAKNEEYTAKAVCLIDAKSGEVAFAMNEEKRLPVASMTKIMTLLVIFDEINKGTLNFEDTVVPSINAQNMGGSQVFLEAGGEYKVKDLMTAIAVASANDACVALAEHIAGSSDGFTDLMNERANGLGMTNTHFANCTGLPAPDGYSSAKDMCIAMRELIKNEQYFELAKIWMTDIVHPKDRITSISNTNKLLKRGIGVDVGKTGFTAEAMHCITASAKKGEERYIACVIGASASKTRFDECEKLLNYGFANFESRAILSANAEISETCPVLRGKIENVSVYPERSYYAFTKKRTPPKEEIKYYFNEVKAPVKKGDKVGEAVIYKDGVEVDRINLLATTDVDRKGFFGIF
ncbi:MAG: D-alanyl-D-alanine carboxypeptidase [Clostridia bacterium]|nr:D-alanyl-D-alanine carboxypeptidase [Clostridia bacterium]